MTKLLRTERAEKWLEFFSTKDKALAVRLAQSIRLVERTEVESALDRMIASEGQRLSHGSIALFAVRELDPDIVDDDFIDPSKHSSRKFPSIRIGGKRQYVAHETYRAYKNGELEPKTYFPVDRSQRPSASRPGAPTGSEGPMANLIRDICQRANAARWLDHPSIEEMRKTKTRLVVLVDDLIGSGKRINLFLTGFFKDKTIKSWFSYNLFDVAICSYGVDTRLKSDLERNPRVASVSAQLLLDAGSPEWSPAEFEAIERLCRDYSHLTARPGWPLGYRDAFTCLCFDYKCPNTAPAILWAASATWRPLFHVRPRLDFPVWPSAPSTNQNEKLLLAAHGQTRLAAADYEHFLSTEGRKAIVLLALAAKRLRSHTPLAAALGIPIDECVRLVATCQARGWLTAGLRLSESGKRELEHARGLKLLVDSDEITLSEEYYVPSSLRASRD